MAYTKEHLIEKGEVLLKRLQKEHRNIRKAYRIRDQDSIDVVARLIVSFQLLADRIATETIQYAQSPPEISLSAQEKADKRGKAKEINDMLSMTFKIRELSKHILSDEAGGYSVSADSNSAEKQSYIEDARRTLSTIDLPLDALNKNKESIEWQEKDKKNQN